MAKLEVRRFKDAIHLLVIPNETESDLIDDVFGDKVDSQRDGWIADVKGVVKLSTDYVDHYIRLEKA